MARAVGRWRINRQFRPLKDGSCGDDCGFRWARVLWRADYAFSVARRLFWWAKSRCPSSVRYGRSCDQANPYGRGRTATTLAPTYSRNIDVCSRGVIQRSGRLCSRCNSVQSVERPPGLHQHRGHLCLLPSLSWAWICLGYFEYPVLEEVYADRMVRNACRCPHTDCPIRRNGLLNGRCGRTAPNPTLQLCRTIGRAAANERPGRSWPTRAPRARSRAS
jgi:hypothetical protein